MKAHCKQFAVTNFLHVQVATFFSGRVPHIPAVTYPVNDQGGAMRNKRVFSTPLHGVCRKFEFTKHLFHWNPGSRMRQSVIIFTGPFAAFLVHRWPTSNMQPRVALDYTYKPHLDSCRGSKGFSGMERWQPLQSWWDTLCKLLSLEHVRLATQKCHL